MLYAFLILLTMVLGYAVGKSDLSERIFSTMLVLLDCASAYSVQRYGGLLVLITREILELMDDDHLLRDKNPRRVYYQRHMFKVSPFP